MVSYEINGFGPTILIFSGLIFGFFEGLLFYAFFAFVWPGFTDKVFPTDLPEREDFRPILGGVERDDFPFGSFSSF